MEWFQKPKVYSNFIIICNLFCSYQVQIDEEKQEFGEELYSKIEDTHPELASKITG